MRIFYNQKLYSNINILIDDPAIDFGVKYWGKEGIIEKSLIDLRMFSTPFGSISLLYGPRQIGKTSSLKLFLSQVTDSETLIFTDCSTILHRQDLAQHLAPLIEGKTTLVLDEVQEVEGWHLALRSLYAEGKLKDCRLWCTGSEARHLLESGERLPGRKGEGVTLFARPWSFREWMHFFCPEAALPFRDIHYKHVTQDWLDAQRVSWEPYWKEYLTTGGIPRVVAHYRKYGTIDDSIWSVYTDWILGNWSRLRTPERSLSAVARRFCETLNTRVSHETFRKGTDILSANTVKTLMEIQEDRFSLTALPRFDVQTQKFLPAKLKKVYPLDPFIAKVWAGIGWNVRRLFDETVPLLFPESSLDECAFRTQMFRHGEGPEPSYLYQDTLKTEVDFYFDGVGFELKSNGRPTAKQVVLLKKCPHAFVVLREKLPLMSYLIGEDRNHVH